MTLFQCLFLCVIIAIIGKIQGETTKICFIVCFISSDFEVTSQSFEMECSFFDAY